MKNTNVAIYKPKGAAGEYAKWACNLYNGCPNECDYCYCRKGFMGSILGGSVPEIKKILGGTPETAYKLFCKELAKYGDQIRRDGGLFFSFSTDPMVEAELPLTLRCIEQCFMWSVPVIILTKSVGWWRYSYEFARLFHHYRHLLAVGFTLTGHDELEKSASSNQDRINLMRPLNRAGFKVWASIEPIVDLKSSLIMMLKAQDYCDHFKVGLMSGVKKDYYNDEELQAMFVAMQYITKPIYLKDSFVKRLLIDRSKLEFPFVNQDCKLIQI